MMRYHYEKPDIYLSMYGKVYFCNHPVYHCCTLFQIGEKGLAVIQQRFDEKTKSTWWGEVDPWITDDLYLHPHFKEYLEMNGNHRISSITEIWRSRYITLMKKPNLSWLKRVLK